MKAIQKTTTKTKIEIGCQEQHCYTLIIFASEEVPETTYFQKTDWAPIAQSGAQRGADFQTSAG